MKTKLKVTLGAFLLFATLTQAQDSSYRQSPSGLTVAEAKLAGVNLKNDFINDKETVKKGGFVGIGASFNTNLFRRTNEALRFRTADYEGVGFAIGFGGAGLWLNGRVDLGWQFQYALGKKIDVGLKTYAMALTDKIPYMGVMFQPSIKLGSLFLDYTGGVQVRFGNTLARNYSEFNLRFLFPNDESYDMDRWYLGIKGVGFSAVNADSKKSTTKMNQGFITLGLML